MPRIFPRDFNLAKASVLVVAIIAGQSAVNAFEPVTGSHLYQTVEHGVFEGMHNEIQTQVTFETGGVLHLEGPLGRFIGDWRVFDDKVCIWLETGPKQGHECASLRQVDDGLYLLSNGVTLQKIATAHPY